MIPTLNVEGETLSLARRVTGVSFSPAANAQAADAQAAAHMQTHPAPAFSRRVAVRRAVAAWFDRYAGERAAWKRRNRFYYATLERLVRHTIPPGARVLELGCGTGELLAAVRPALGVGVDVSERMLAVARRTHAPDTPAGTRLQFVRADAHELPFHTTFDYVICSDLIGHLEDIQVAFEQLHHVCTPQTKVVITYWNFA